MERANTNIRNEIKKAGLYYWAVADAAGISPYTLSIWLRKELSGERLRLIEKAITDLKGGGST